MNPSFMIGLLLFDVDFFEPTEPEQVFQSNPGSASRSECSRNRQAMPVCGIPLSYFQMFGPEERACSDREQTAG